MSNKEMNKNDQALETMLSGIGNGMLPPPELEKAVIAGVPYRGRVAAGVHIRKFAGAILAYAVGIMLFLGAIFLLPRLFSEQTPVGTQSNNTSEITAPVTTDEPPLIDRDKLTNPDALTPIQLELTLATWEKYKDSFLPQTTIDSVADYYTRTFITPCGDGYALFAIDPQSGYPQALMRELLGSYEFRYADYDTLDYYEDGEFYPLADAYAAKLFTDDDLRGVWEAYKNKYPSRYTPEADAEWEYLYLDSIVSSDPDTLLLPERYTEAELKAFRAIWAVYQNKESRYKLRTINDICTISNTFTVYGDAILCADIYGRYSATTDTVLGYQFIYPWDTPLRVFANGTIYTLQQSFDAGLLTAEDIHTLWKAHYEKYAQYYSSDTPVCEHDYVLTNVQSSCTEDIVTTYTCKHCDSSYIETTPARGHSYQFGICSECGEQAPASEGLEFEPSGTQYYRVVGLGTCTDTDIVIPSTYEGKPVKYISGRAFYNCTAITSVIIPDSVTHMEFAVFKGCTSLKSVTIGNRLSCISDEAFSGCSSLTDITFIGTESKWNTVVKFRNWDLGMPDYTVHYTVKDPNSEAVLNGDEIVDLIKESGCPEDKLIYGFDTQVDKDELDRIKNFLLYSDAPWVFSEFSPSFYDATEVSVYGILYNSSPYTETTQAEKEAYYEYYNMSEELQEIFDPRKLTTDELRTYLMTYLGIDFTDRMKAELASQVYYSEEYDAYYIANTDFAGAAPQYYHRAYKNPNGYILVVTDVHTPTGAVILAPNGDGYRIVMAVGRLGK